MNISQQAIEHIKSLLFIAEELRESGIAVYRHSYYPMVFGSFTLELGKPHSRILFVWDGKESNFSISFAALENQNENSHWDHNLNLSLPGGEGVYQEITSHAVAMISANK